jgi:hypothetical protein
VDIEQPAYGYAYRWGENEDWALDKNYVTPAGAVEAAMVKLRQGYMVALTHLTVDEMKSAHAKTQKVG